MAGRARKKALVLFSGVADVDVDAGTVTIGKILGPGAKVLRCDGHIVAVVGDKIAPHGIGLHANAVIVEGSPDVFAEAKAGGIRPIAREGDLCSCGDRIAVGSIEVAVDAVNQATGIASLITGFSDPKQ